MDENIREEDVVATETEGGNEPMTLDDALAAARAEIEAREAEGREEAIAEEAVAEEAPIPEEQNVPPEAPSAPVQQPIVNPEAEAMRAQIAQQNQMLMQYQQQMQAMQAQMQAMQQSQNAAETVAEAVMTPPKFNFSSLIYAPDDEQEAAEQKYAEEVTQYVRGKLMEEFAPVVNDFHAREAEIQRNNVKDEYRNNPQFAGFRDREAWIEHIIEKNPKLKELPFDKQYQIGYLITQGVDAVKARNNPPPAPAPKTMDEMLFEVENNPELMRALEAKRVKGIAQGQQDNPPPFVAGGGSNRVGLNVPNEPTDFDMAREGAYNYLRGRR